MPLENKNRVTDKNVGDHVQKKCNTDFTRLHLQNLQKEAEMGASSSTRNKRVESLEILKRRSGRTAPGSEIPLTGKGLLGGMDRGHETSQQLIDRQRRERSSTIRTHGRQRRLFEQNPDNATETLEEMLERHRQEIANQEARHRQERESAGMVPNQTDRDRG